MVTRFFPGLLHRHIRNAKVQAFQKSLLTRGSNSEFVVDYLQRTAFLALKDAEVAVAKESTKNGALVALGRLMSPTAESGYRNTIIGLRQSIKTGTLDDRDHVVSLSEARVRAEELSGISEGVGTDFAIVAAFEVLKTAGVTEVHFAALWLFLTDQQTGGTYGTVRPTGQRSSGC
jgi:hypothetical protein